MLGSNLHEFANAMNASRALGRELVSASSGQLTPVFDPIDTSTVNLPHTGLMVMALHRCMHQMEPGGGSGSGLVALAPYMTESPFETLDHKEVHADGLDRLIAHARTGLLADYGVRLADRLASLVEAAQEEHIAPSALSLQSLIRFLQVHPHLPYPDVVLTADGKFRVEWRRSARKFLAIEFFEDGETKFVLFTPDKGNAVKIVRIAGSAPSDSVMDIVAKLGGSV